MRSALLSIGLALTVSGCAGGNYVRAPSAAPVPPAAAGTTFRAPEVMHGGGIDSIIGAQAPALTRRFGEARIDLAEGDARKLQFAAAGCVLDIYLYPLEAGGTPVATHIEARQRQGGGETDRAACIAEVEASTGG